MNNKVYSAIKVSLFIGNYKRELRMKVDIRKKRKSRKSDGVCGKNKEDARGYEEASGQKKKEE